MVKGVNRDANAAFDLKGMLYSIGDGPIPSLALPELDSLRTISNIAAPLQFDATDYPYSPETGQDFDNKKQK